MNSTTRRGVLMSGVRCGITILASCALIAPAAAQSPQQSGDRQQAQQETKTVGSSIIADSEDIVRDPARYYGRKVMIQPADVNRVINPHAFMLDEDAMLAGPDILVIVPNPSGGALSENAEVRVTGTVRPYVTADLERDFDWFDENDVEVEFTDRPVIIAESVTSSDGREWAGVITRQPAQAAAAGQGHEVLTAGAIAEHPERYIGQRVTVRAEVEAIYNPQLFTLDEDRMFVGPDVIVYARDGRTSLTEDQDDQIVTVTGEVRKFIESDLFGSATWFDPWFRDLDETGRGLVRSRPVIIADSVAGETGAQLYTANRPEAGAETAVGTTGTASEARLTAGRTVDATGTIHTVANDAVFWITMEGRPDPVLVVGDRAAASGWKPAVKQRVVINGTVKKAPGADQMFIHAVTVAPAKP